MKLKSLQREIAHICGWTDMVVKTGTRGVLFGRHASIPASNVFGIDGVPVPNFPENLNAMNIAETMLKPEERDTYLAAIASILEDQNPVWAIRHAPPSILVAAFMSVIKQRTQSQNGHILISTSAS